MVDDLPAGGHQTARDDPLEVDQGRTPLLVDRRQDLLPLRPHRMGERTGTAAVPGAPKGKGHRPEAVARSELSRRDRESLSRLT